MNLKNIKKNAVPTVVRAAGAVVSSKITSMIPVGSDKAKAGIVTVIGLLMSGSGKGVVQQLGEGVAIGGVLNLAKSFGIAGGDFINPVAGIEDARWLRGSGMSGFDDLYAGGTIGGGGDDFNFNDSYRS